MCAIIALAHMFNKRRVTQMARRHINTTKLEIVQVATKMFLEKGYSNTSAKAICEELGISTGNLTFHFATKEHLLAVLVEMVCDFQWGVMEQATDEGKTSLLAQCLELTAMAVVCEENEIGRDFYISAYTHPMTLDIIRKNDAKKARLVFGEYCPDWKELNYKEAEVIVSGIEYATLMTTESSGPLDVRIAGALGGIMMMYNVPEEIRRRKIDKVLAMDYRSIARKMLKDFVEYVEGFTEEDLERYISGR